MSENKEINASDVIDMILEYLDDIEVLEEACEDGGYIAVSRATHEKDRSHTKLTEMLDDYIDQRVIKMLDKAGLCKIINPMN